MIPNTITEMNPLEKERVPKMKISPGVIPLSVPLIRGNEWKYVKECLDTGWVSSAGKFVTKFEEDICGYTGAKHAVACVNGTAALHVALRLAGVRPGDEVIVPTVTFIAPVNVIRYLNAEPVFMDCDEFYNIDVAKTIEFIEKETSFVDGYTLNRTTNRRISAIIPVHVFGNAVDLERLIPICRERNIKIVEDASESLGTYYTRGSLSNRHTGTIGDLGCYSFNGNKIITAGGGGMIVTSDAGLAEKAGYLTTQAKDDPVRYIHNEIGYNYRLTNIQAALGVAQLEKLEEYIAIKKNNYRNYRDYINKIDGLVLAGTPDYSRVNYWMYSLRIDKRRYGKDRDELMKYLIEQGIQTRPVWYLNHSQKPYRDCLSYRIDRANELVEATLQLPCSANLTIGILQNVVETLRQGKAY